MDVEIELGGVRAAGSSLNSCAMIFFNKPFESVRSMWQIIIVYSEYKRIISAIMSATLVMMCSHAVILCMCSIYVGYADALHQIFTVKEGGERIVTNTSMLGSISLLLRLKSTCLFSLINFLSLLFKDQSAIIFLGSILIVTVLWMLYFKMDCANSTNRESVERWFAQLRVTRHIIVLTALISAYKLFSPAIDAFLY